jgi:hypothetical protein
MPDYGFFDPTTGRALCVGCAFAVVDRHGLGGHVLLACRAK